LCKPDSDFGTYSAALGALPQRSACTFYLALYWAQALAAQRLEQSEAAIKEELLAAQGAPAEIGGYYRPDAELCANSMRPGTTFNAIIDAL